MLFRLAARARPNFRPLWGAQRRFMATEKKVQQTVSIPWIIGGVSLGAAVWQFSLDYLLTAAEHGGHNDASNKGRSEAKIFSKEDTTVVFVLGGPGAGKGTQCENLVRDYGFTHLSAGDLLREERNREGSQYGELINHYIKEGLIVPMEITIKLLEIAMVKSGSKRFLIDGFPRKMDQALEFEKSVVDSAFVLYFECPEEVMLKRLLKRGETSGRVDDNVESIKKRFKTFHETSFPVIKHYEALGKVRKLSCQNTPDKVYEQVRKVFDDHFGSSAKKVSH